MFLLKPQLIGLAGSILVLHGYFLISHFPWNAAENNVKVFEPGVSSFKYTSSNFFRRVDPIENIVNDAIDDINLWPLPKTFTFGNATLGIHSSLDIELYPGSDAEMNPTIKHAIDRFRSLAFLRSAVHEKENIDVNKTPMIKMILLSIKDTSEAHIQMDTNESYHLAIPTSGNVMIHAENSYGIMRGLETLSQLVEFDFDTESYSIHKCPWDIHDTPRFVHRGLMIDTSRHFLPIPVILKAIDSISYAKLNVLHWHMSDDQSFPMQIHSHKDAWKGAFSPIERYLQSDIKRVVEYGRLRAIRVMVEFDMPGHASSWCKGMPEICPSPTCLTPLNVMKNETFDVITDILHECTGGTPLGGLFPEGLIHLGGDEVDLSCWNKSEDISSWLKGRNMTLNDGYKFFVDRAAKIALDQGRRPVQWVEVFEQFGDKLDKRTIIHVWKAKSTLKSVVEAGYNAILSNWAELYLDHLDVTWQKLYEDEPMENITDTTQQALILGGQAEMWGETVDGSDWESTVWPRTAAFAERMWSHKAVASTADAMRRLTWFRCLLLLRGVGAAPVSNTVARQSPSSPGSCRV